MAGSAWWITRSLLVDEREDSAVRQLYVDARLVRAALREGDADIAGVLATVGGGTDAELLVERRGEWFAAGVRADADRVPPSLRNVVAAGGAGQQRYRDGSGELRLAQGVALAAVDAAFYEIASLDELESTLGVLRTSLTIGVLASAAVASAAGYRIAARLGRPLDDVGAAARRIAAGQFDTRLDAIDPDLRALADAFNEMAARLDARVKRDVRFAADVSHELRSPLAAIAASVEVIARRRDELPPAAQAAYDVLAERVATFRRSVDDLLEISRLDAGQVDLRIERLDGERFVGALLAARGLDDVPALVEPGTVIVGDRRRLAQAVGNLLDNAKAYAGGPTAVHACSLQDGTARIAVEDAGPGVAPEERTAVFERFARGRAGIGAGQVSGTGLGLALVAEHVALHEGKVWVEDREGGGARFVIEIPPLPVSEEVL